MRQTFTGLNVQHDDSQPNTERRWKFNSVQVPLTITKSAVGALRAVPFEDADYCFLDRFSSPFTGIYNTTRSVFGVSVIGTSVCTSGTEYFYAKVSQYILSSSEALIVSMTRHFSGLYQSYFYDDPLNLKALFRDRFPERGENRSLTRTELAMLPKSKISGAHHYHFNTEQVLDSVEAAVSHRIEAA